MATDNRKDKDCLACRLVTGFGLMGIGFYIYTQSKNRGKFQANTMRFISASVACLGIARLTNMPLLKVKD